MSTSDCPQCQAWMEDAFSGELEATSRAAMERHVQSCAECRAIWEDYQTLRRGLRVLADTEGPSLKSQTAVLRAAEARLEKHSTAEAGGFWRWLLNPATIAFATLVLVLGVGILGRQELQKRKASEQASPVIAPQTTPAKGNASPAISVPPPATDQKLDLESIKMKAASPAEKPAPAKKELSAPLHEFQAEKQSPKQAPPPAPPPAIEAGSGNSIKSVIPEAKPPEAAKPPPPQEVAPAGLLQAPASGGTAADEAQHEAPKQEDLGRNKDKASEGPAPAAGATESYRAQPVSKSLERKSASEESRRSTLLQSAKEKIQKKNYRGALDDLLAAQKIQDNAEIQDLILLCRSHLRGDE